MSTYIRGVNLSKKWLKIIIFTILAVVCATAITLGVVLSQKDNFVVTPDTNSKTESLDSGALLSSTGWNNSILSKLTDNVTQYGDNVALGNAGGSIVSSVIELGGISWTVVYMQDGIVTLYANEAVATLPFGDDDYSGSDVREYLNNVFYPQFIEKIGYDNIESYIIPYGADEIYYQAAGAQAIELSTLNKGEISGNDGINGDKIWIPSAYEVGGFANTSTSPKARVNSFKTIEASGFTLNSGLWNTSNNIRLGDDASWLRSSVNGAQAVLKDGVVKQANAADEYGVRPCINIALPGISDVSDEVVSVNGDVNTSANDAILASATPDYTGMLAEAADSGDGSQGAPFVFSTSEFLVILSDAVMAGQNMSGLYFQMGGNIDMSDVTVWNPIGRQGFVFSGNFDGNGYTISNLSTAGSGLVGLFGYVDNATITRVGVINSSWYTTNSYVGAIAGNATNSFISQCYSDCGISGYNYVGGLVGAISASAGSAVEGATKGIVNSYNLNGITGHDYVGGIVGSVSGSLVGNCYNIGATQGTAATAIGGIAGANGGGSVINCIYYNSTNNNIGTPITSYETLRDKNAVATTYPNWAFRPANASGVWFMSNVVNDRLPMLYCFMKEATINLTSNTPDCTVSSTVTTATINTPVTITASAASSVGKHYQFVGWYHYDVDAAGNKIEGSEREFKLAADTTKGALAGGYYPFTYAFPNGIDDYYNLEAKFVRLYNFNIDPMFNGFTSAYAGGSTFSYSASTTPLNEDLTENASGVWYTEGTVLTINIGADAQRSYNSLLVGTQNGAVNTNVPNFGAGDAFYGLTGDSTTGWTYTITINDEYNKFSGGDTFWFRPVFDRVYQVTAVVTPPSGYSGTMPVGQVAFTDVSGAGVTVSTAKPGDSKNILFNNSSVNVSITNSSAITGLLKFKDWTLSNADGSLVGTIVNPTITTESETYSLLASLGNTATVMGDDVTTLRFTATFEYDQKTISITEYLDATANSAPGIVFLSSTEILDTSTINADNLSIQVSYASTVHVYVKPDYANGYDYELNTIKGEDGIALPADPSTGVYHGTFVADFTEASAAYDVVYSVMNTYSLAFNVTVDGVAPTDSSIFTFPNQSVSGLTLDAALSDYTVSVSDAEYMKYFLNNVNATIGGQTYNNIVAYQPSGIYQGTQGPQTIFDSTVSTLRSLYKKAGVIPAKNNQAITVTVNFITITRSITVIENLDGAQTPLGKYSITATGVTNGKADSDYILNDQITLTATSGNIGYRVDSITISGPTGTPSYTPAKGQWNNSGSITFTLTENATITINYTQRPYTITIGDNLNTEISADIPNLSVGAGYKNAYQYSINNAPAQAYVSAINAKYSNSLTITGYQTTFDVSIDSLARKAVLNSIVVMSGGSVVKTYEPTTEFQYELNDEYDNIQVVFVYRLLQALNVSFTDSIAGGDSASLVVLVNKDDPNDRIVMVIPAGGNVTVDCQVANYDIYVSVAIFIQTEVSGDGVTGEDSYQIAIQDGQAASVVVEVTKILNGTDSVFGSGTI